MDKTKEEARGYIKSLSERLLYIMGTEEYTLNEMAEVCGISKRTLCDIVYRETSNVSMITLIKIANGIKVPMPELWQKQNDKAILKQRNS